MDKSDEKSLLLASYQKHLLNLEHTRIEITDDEGVVIVGAEVKPHCHYLREHDEFLVFFNPGFKELLKTLNEMLDDLIQKQFSSFVGRPMRKKAASFSESEEFEDLAKALGMPNNEKLKNKIWESSVLSVKQKAQILASLIYNINTCINLFGETIDPEKQESAVAFIFNRNLRDVGFVHKANYAEIESAFIEAMKRKSDCERVMAVKDELAKYKEAENLTEMGMVDFAFALYRADHYLSILERNLLLRPLDELEEMNDLRCSIFAAMLTHNFLNCQNAAPFFGVEIDRCQVLSDTDVSRRIYVERNYATAFIERLFQSLRRRGTEITGNFDAIGIEEMARIATTESKGQRSIDISKVEQAIERITFKRDKSILGGFHQGALAFGSTLKDQEGVIGLVLDSVFPGAISNIVKSAIHSQNLGEKTLAVEQVKKLQDVDMRQTEKKLGLSIDGKVKDIWTGGVVDLKSTCKSKGMSDTQAGTIARMVLTFLHAGKLSKSVEALKKLKGALVAQNEKAQEFVLMFRLFITLHQLNLGNQPDIQGVLIEQTIKDYGFDVVFMDFNVELIRRLKW